MKLFKSLVGLTAILSVVPYKIEKKEEDGKKSISLTSLTWKSEYTPSTDTEEATLNIDLLGGLADTVNSVKKKIFEKEANVDFCETVVVCKDCDDEACGAEADASESAEAVSPEPVEVAETANAPLFSEIDPKYAEAVEIALESGKVSTSMLQRRLSIGYGRASKIITAMEENKIITPPDGQKPRMTLITPAEWDEIKAKQAD